MARILWRSFPAVCSVNVSHDESEVSLLSAAEAGNFLKECVLAQILFERGDYNEAFKHYSRASERGSAGATHNVGLMTDIGIGTVRSVPDAVKFYRRAARDGIVEARHRLGYHLALAGGDDVAEGVRLIHSAAEEGLPEAMYDLGMMNLYDVALTKGSARAHTGMVWLKRAFGTGRRRCDTEDVAAAAAFHLATAAYTVPVTKPDTHSVRAATASPPSIKERYSIAYQYAKYAADAGHALAQDFLGQILVKGDGDGDGPAEGTAENMKEAAKWFGAAAAQGVISSKRDLALLVEVGMVNADADAKAMAARLYREAADAGDMVAKFRLGICHGTGKLVEQDTSRSRELLFEAARGDCIPAIVHVLSTKMVEPGADEETNFKMALTKIARRERHPGRIDAIRALASLGAIPSCHACGVTKYEIEGVSLGTCGTCKAARYCSRACQQSDWNDHRAECKAITRAKETIEAAIEAAGDATAAVEKEDVAQAPGTQLE